MASQSRYTNASLLLITREKETLFIYIIISLDFCYLTAKYTPETYGPSSMLSL